MSRVDSTGLDGKGHWIPTRLNVWKPGIDGTAFDNASNYIGAHFDHMYVAPCMTHRDADILQRSNWLEQSKILDALTGNIWNDEGINGSNNWAVGWTECYLIHPNNEPALRAAEELADALENYPILNEESFSNMEYEEANECWASCNVRERAEYAERYACEWTPMQLRHDYISALTDSGDLSYGLTRG